MASAVYLLCAVTSAVCALLLTRAYFNTKTRLLLWSSLCFIFLMFSNALLFVDLALLPRTLDLSMARTATSAIGAGLMLVGLIWESR